ncbi:MAG: TetR/AcrR family transcriptional regulator [Alphaproteobacteria bacterium]|nr:TetR/AcrR family transcriptional regulator [Alphaproteobacteria bacterium]MDE2011910.1 TetR/AcrR family transcriptional regulator [Alphaproteobacteria bacterium]MDE2073925.1 TetR/AcrR family transcriptional regulator [Alphaproteobacteria bacterium]MDE2353043.1 TetR/AcrR family transcriptional regulator [Alphaproteobacteria bacterium]
MSEVMRSAADSRSKNKRQDILEAAARQFSASGFHGANMRDVAADAGVLAGSIYYHFESKEALYVAVHAAAVDMMTEAVRAAIAGITDPWQRLEEAAAAHCEALNSESALLGVISPVFPVSGGDLRAQLTAQRDVYEQMFGELIDGLLPDEEIDPKVLRLHILAALNGTKFWYKPGGKTPSDIGRQLIRALRRT